MAEIAALGLKVEGVGNIDSASSSLDRLKQSGDAADRSSQAMVKGFGQVTSILADISRSVSPLSAHLGSLSKTIAAAAAEARKQAEALNKKVKEGESVTQIYKVRVDELEKELADVSKETKNASDSTERFGRVARQALGAIAAALSVRQIQVYADTWSDLTSRIQVSIGPQQDAADVMERISDIARMTYSDLESTAESFARNSVTLRALGKSTNEMLDYTEALNNALVVSGAKADRAEMVQNSLAKAMAEGTLRGEELNNVLNSGSRIAELLAEELGVNITELRSVAKEGKITGDVIYRSLVGNMEVLAEQAGSMPATIGDAFTLMRNAVLQSVGVYDQQNGLSEALAENLVAVSDAIRDTDWMLYIDGVKTAASITAAYLVAINAVPASIALASTVTRAYASIIGAATAANAATISAKLADINASRAQALATSQAAAAEVALLRVTQLSLVAQLRSAQTTAQQASIRAQLAANTVALTAAQNAYTTSTAAASAATVAKARSVALLTTGMANLLSVAASFYAGWQIGTYLRNEFEVVERAGIALMGGLHTMTIRIGGFFKVMGENIKFAVMNPLDAIRGAIADMLEWVSGLGQSALNFLGFEGLAEGIKTEFAGIRGATAAEHKATLDQIRTETANQIGTVNDIYADMFAQVGKDSSQAAETVATLNDKTETLNNTVVELTAAQKALATAFEQTLAGYHRQLNLAQNATEVEQLLYEVQHGRLKGLLPAQAKMLEDMARELDMRAKLRQIEEDQKEINRDRDSIARELMTEEEAILASYARRKSIVEAATFENEQARTELLLRLEEERNEALIEANGSYWERWLLAAEDNLSNFDELSKTVVDNFTTGFGNAFESMILDSENLGDAMQNMAQGMVRSVVNAIGQMIAQELAYQAILALRGSVATAAAATEVAAIGATTTAAVAATTTTTTAQVAAATTTAAAWTPAAFMASIGSFGAAAAIGIAAVLALGALGGFRKGGYTGNGGVDDVAGVVHGKEFVFDAASTAAIGVDNLEAMRSGRALPGNVIPFPTAAGGGSAGAPPIVNVYNNDNTRAEVSTSRDDQGRDVIDIVVRNLLTDGEIADAVGRITGTQFQGA